MEQESIDMDYLAGMVTLLEEHWKKTAGLIKVQAIRGKTAILWLWGLQCLGVVLGFLGWISWDRVGGVIIGLLIGAFVMAWINTKFVRDIVMLSNGIEAENTAHGIHAEDYENVS